MHVPLYDDFVDYDRFVRWEQRLAHELPFIEARLQAAGARHVLDTACGTGRHAIALAQRGYQVTAVDLSAKMIDRARANAVVQNRAVRFSVAGFGELAARLDGPFDALLCLGNSLPHVRSIAHLGTTLVDFAAVLRPSGLLLIQIRNFDRVLGERQRWMPPLSHQEQGREWLFVRLYDWNADGTISFHVMTLQRQDEGEWTQQVSTTSLFPIVQATLFDALSNAGFTAVECWGNMDGSSFMETSPNLIVAARKQGAVEKE